MAEFAVSHLKSMRVEGASNWNPDDKGNIVVDGVCRVPTYAGVAPRYHSSWPGFKIVQEIAGATPGHAPYDTPAFWVWKRKLDKALSASTALQTLVRSFYRANFWEANRLGEIKSQSVADWIYDHVINAGGRGARWAQLAAKVTPDGGIGPVTLAAINSMDAEKFLERAADIAGAYRLDVGHNSPSQIQFVDSWLQRDGQPPEIIAMVKAAARDGRLDDAEIEHIKETMGATA